MSQNDPFAGTTRLNQLNEREMLLRNERMVNPQLRQFYHLTDEERNREYHKFYIGLSEARVRDMVEKGNQEDTEVLPYGWNERMSVTHSITGFTEEIYPTNLHQTQQVESNEVVTDSDKPVLSTRQHGYDTHQAPAARTQEENEQNMLQYLAAGEEVKRLQYEVRDKLIALSAAEKDGDEAVISKAKSEFDSIREEFKYAQSEEFRLLQLVSGR